MAMNKAERKAMLHQLKKRPKNTHWMNGKRNGLNVLNHNTIYEKLAKVKIMHNGKKWSHCKAGKRSLMKAKRNSNTVSGCIDLLSRMNETNAKFSDKHNYD